MSYMVKFLEAA